MILPLAASWVFLCWVGVLLCQRARRRARARMLADLTYRREVAESIARHPASWSP